MRVNPVTRAGWTNRSFARKLGWCWVWVGPYIFGWGHGWAHGPRPRR